MAQLAKKMTLLIARDQAAILAWYDRHQRVLPWRAPPGQKADPYHVWLSEIMLQQTIVATVASYFTRFITTWPTIQDLANADLHDVLSAWAGLGYYARARNLHACAKMVAKDHGGRFPAEEAALLALPGIGPYTAAAISAIAFGLPASPVDGNIERVMSRRFGITQPLPGAKVAIKAAARSMTPAHRPGDFAQSLMDLGASLCSVRRPKCDACPLTENCVGRAQGIAETLPVKPAKALRPTRYGTAFLAIRRDGSVLLRRRPPKGLLGGMMEVPSTVWDQTNNPAAPGDQPLRAHWQAKPGQVEHVFTHFRLLLSLYCAEGIPMDQALPDPSFQWVSQADLPNAALPTLMKKVLALGGIRPVRP